MELEGLQEALKVEIQCHQVRNIVLLVFESESRAETSRAEPRGTMRHVAAGVCRTHGCAPGFTLKPLLAVVWLHVEPLLAGMWSVDAAVRCGVWRSGRDLNIYELLAN